MASGAPDLEGRFVGARQSFPGIPLGSRAFFLAHGCSWH
jgi:hypothetical protein